MSRMVLVVLWVVLFPGVRAALASEPQDSEMYRLATAKGCHICHSLEPKPAGSKETLPIGPAWKDVAKRYKGQKDAANRLTRIVLQASGEGPEGRHWKGQAKGVAMPANTLVINEADARKLVRWILSLDN